MSTTSAPPKPVDSLKLLSANDGGYIVLGDDASRSLMPYPHFAGGLDACLAYIRSRMKRPEDDSVTIRSIYELNPEFFRREEDRAEVQAAADAHPQ